MIIYEIVCNITGDRYIGSTNTRYFSNRMSSHTHSARHKLGKYTSEKIIRRGDYQVNKLETGDFGKEREQYYIDTLPNINNYRVIGKDKERNKKKEADWRDKHKEQLRKNNIRRKRWQSSMGGDSRRHNNLLMISMDLFE